MKPFLPKLPRVKAMTIGIACLWLLWSVMCFGFAVLAAGIHSAGGVLVVEALILAVWIGLPLLVYCVDWDV